MLYKHRKCEHIFILQNIAYVDFSLTVDSVSLSQSQYTVTEGSNVVNITLMRSGDLLDDTSIPFRTKAITSAVNAAICKTVYYSH